MKRSELEPLLTAIAAAVRLHLNELSRRISNREAQLKNLKYVGVWRAGRQYLPGNFTTHAGSVWHCNAETSETPGKSNDWALALKAGKDARCLPLS